MLIRNARLASWRGPSLFGLCLLLALYCLLSRRDLLAYWEPARYSAAWTQHASAFVPFWKDLAGELEAARPKCPPVSVVKEEMSDHDKSWEPLEKKERPDRLELSEQDEGELMRAHRQMRLAAKRLGPALPTGHDIGIVTTGGLKLFPVLLVSLRMLRRTGCTLPVEVFLGDQAEYDQVASVCEDVLPNLNAQCRTVGEIYSQATVAPPEHFQFKVLAILFSSYKEVLFLDADAFPAHDPTPLFSKPPYTTHGLVTWPGFYANAASPHFYHIAGIPEPPVNRGTESGQLLLNKSQHRESLMMMVYYNYYGPNYYYPLQAQGGPGQGDKETFGAGALAVGAPLYAVKTPVSMLGIHVDGNFRFAGAAQPDPVQDYMYEPPPPTHLLPKYEWDTTDSIRHAPDSTSSTTSSDAASAKSKARAFFVHTVSSDTKIDPNKILRKGGLAWAENGNSHRIWGEEKAMVDLFGFDVEKRMWECVVDEACRTEVALCKDAKAFYAKVFGG